jgi:hypothetical protein
LVRNGQYVGAIVLEEKEFQRPYSEYRRALSPWSNDNSDRKLQFSTQLHCLKAENQLNTASIGFSGISRPTTTLALIVEPFIGFVLYRQTAIQSNAGIAIHHWPSSNPLELRADCAQEIHSYLRSESGSTLKSGNPTSEFN